MNKKEGQAANNKKWSILFVRLLPFVIFSHIYFITQAAYDGIIIEDSEFILGNSFIYALSFLMLSIKDDRYHCVWNRAMWAELIFIPSFNFLDNKFFDLDNMIYLEVINKSFDITLFLTAVLAFNHFVLPRIRKRHGTNE